MWSQTVFLLAGLAESFVRLMIVSFTLPEDELVVSFMGGDGKFLVSASRVTLVR